MAFSADNRQIVSGSRDKTIKLWNTLGEAHSVLECAGLKQASVVVGRARAGCRPAAAHSLPGRLPVQFVPPAQPQVCTPHHLPPRRRVQVHHWRARWPHRVGVVRALLPRHPGKPRLPQLLPTSAVAALAVGG